jgi:SH3-like domain-containing protein
VVKRAWTGALRRAISKSMFRHRLALLLLVSLVLSTPASGDQSTVPYWASIQSSEVNMRVGPGEDYKIAWVYRRKHLPLKVLRLKEGWRFVEDPGGAKGWVLARFLTRERGAIVTGKEPAEMRDGGSDGAKLLWRVAPGVVGLLGDCDAGWCEFRLDQGKGYLRQDRLWGAGAP